VRDAIEPRSQEDLPLVGLERLVGAQHRRLDRLLGVLRVPGQRPAVAVQRVAVTVEENLERARLPTANEADEPSIGAGGARHELPIRAG
jgi:hypothetical protein